MVNLRVMLHYADGTNDVRDLVSPFDIGDCWSTRCSRFHDTAANGFENLGGRFGSAGSAEVADMIKPISVGTGPTLCPSTFGRSGWRPSPPMSCSASWEPPF